MPLLQGTLDMLILRTLIFGPRHGHGIAVTIQRTSDEDLLVDHGSLYPALQRLERQGLLKSKWGTSELNRRARFYELTRAGRQKLTAETGKWERMVRAIGRVLQHPKRGGALTCSGAAARVWTRKSTSHLAQETADNIARGMDPDGGSARRAAHVRQRRRRQGNGARARPAVLARHAVAGHPIRVSAHRAKPLDQR